jgi:DNA-binding transcriptional MerR regulator/methylmalonyl-CoA mutase cobalamin-binding subunit
MLSIYFIDSLLQLVQDPAVTEAGAKGAAEAGTTYSLGAVSRLTGLSAHVLRAWERRYGAVTPLRTPGGTRRYRESDVARLQLLAAATGAGHPIGDIARLSEAELRRRSADAGEEPRPPLRRILEAIEQFDADEAERLLGLQLAALGPRGFIDSVVDPLLRQVGDRWEDGSLCVAAEHLASAAIRNLLGLALRRKPRSGASSPILFTTVAGERHELGALACAVVAVDLGANAIYLGPDLPAEEVVAAARAAGADTIAISTSGCAPAIERERALRALRRALPEEIALWLGGRGSEALELPAGAERIDGIDGLEQKIRLKALRR